MLKTIMMVALLCLTTASFAGEQSRNLLSAWSIDCEQMEKNRWFALESWGDDQFMLIFCAGFKCIPYPGFWKPFDIYHDERIKWLSETAMEVTNDDKDAGWQGAVVFHRCKKY